MNTSNFLQILFEDNLGLDKLGLEDHMPDLVKLIDRKTIPAFSECIPCHYLTYLDLTDRSKIVRKDQHTLGVEYHIGDPILDKFDLPIRGVEKVRYNNVSGVDPYDPDSTAYYNSLITSRNNMTLEGMLMGSLYTEARTMMDNATPFKPYHEYRGGKIIYMRNWAYQGVVEIEIKTSWPTIASIPDEYREILLELAEFDIKISLWNELKYIEDVPTPDGNLSLRFDWSDQEDRRKDYLRELRTRSITDRTGPRYFQLL